MMTREQREYLISQLFIHNNQIKLFNRLHSLYAERDYGPITQTIFYNINELRVFIGNNSLTHLVLNYIDHNKNTKFYAIHANKQPIDFDVMDKRLDELFIKLFHAHSFHVVCEISLTEDDVKNLKYYKKEVKKLLLEYKDFYVVKQFLKDDLYYFIAKLDTTKIFELGQGYAKRLIEEHLANVTFDSLLTTNLLSTQSRNDILL